VTGASREAAPALVTEPKGPAAVRARRATGEALQASSVDYQIDEPVVTSRKAQCRDVGSTKVPRSVATCGPASVHERGVHFELNEGAARLDALGAHWVGLRNAPADRSVERSVDDEPRRGNRTARVRGQGVMPFR
jgi:hypothetical protein